MFPTIEERRVKDHAKTTVYDGRDHPQAAPVTNYLSVLSHEHMRVILDDVKSRECALNEIRVYGCAWDPEHRAPTSTFLGDAVRFRRIKPCADVQI